MFSILANDVSNTLPDEWGKAAIGLGVFVPCLLASVAGAYCPIAASRGHRVLAGVIGFHLSVVGTLVAAVVLVFVNRLLAWSDWVMLLAPALGALLAYKSARRLVVSARGLTAASPSSPTKAISPRSGRIGRDRTLIETIKQGFAEKSSAELREMVAINDLERWSTEAILGAREILEDRAEGTSQPPLAERDAASDRPREHGASSENVKPA